MIFILITYWNNIILDVFIECEGFIYVSTWLSHIIQMNTNLAVPWKVFFNIIKIPNQLTLTISFWIIWLGLSDSIGRP